MKYLAFLAFFFLNLACTPQQRLNRFLERHPYLRTIKDTIVINDTITYEAKGWTADTTYSINKILKFDSLVLRKENVTSYVYLKDSLLHNDLNAEPLRDTIYIRNRVPVSKFAYEKKNFLDKMTSNLFSFLLLLLIVLLLFYLIRFIFKKILLFF